ncbi:hypothetical protein DFP72DRAFT_909388 [Ephemerocybe angulata]|uniref:Heat shock 70 kDa protein 12A n=1 Tax=Ephemerocybe angulata TaxID=980116 RepID=A0A8H6M450_9AGAR|nr:hypothetical protein DFP72DRAFT_909388 [Tulosesus angulatus]
MKAHSTYKGTRRKLLLAFDVGTTYSGISYSILDPGQIPEIKAVTRFPAQEYISGASKIPTLIYYDRAGAVKAVGAEAVSESTIQSAEEHGWTKAEWFKLHLLPNPHTSPTFARAIPPLPPNKTASNALSDVLHYLHSCAASYIQETHSNGRDLWAQTQHEVEYVFSHPNGWEGFQRQQMRDASVAAGIVPDERAAEERIMFVSEGEASLHYAVHNGLPQGALENNDGVIIVDAGGGTIDLSAYAQRGVGNFEEIAAPQCHLHGSLSVTFNARTFLKSHLAQSTYLDDLDHIVDCFDKTTKLRFRNAQEPQYIKFGSTRDNDKDCNIRIGQMKLSGSEVASFFAPAVQCIVNAVLEQRRTSHKPISHVVLVGGFSGSDWLFEQVSQALHLKGLNVVRPDNHINKAVSDGAISFYLDHLVRTRVSTLTYGQFCSLKYNPLDPEHRARPASQFTAYSGETRIRGYFDVILAKNTQVSETKEFREEYCQKSTERDFFRRIVYRIECYRGGEGCPRWRDTDPTMYAPLCTIEMDFSHLALQPRYLLDAHGQVRPGTAYYQVDYAIVLSFGLTELKAQIAWMENGKERRSPAKIIYDPDITTT